MNKQNSGKKVTERKVEIWSPVTLGHILSVARIVLSLVGLYFKREEMMALIKKSTNRN